MLYLIATPIGHLGDITFRAISTLKECALILCEDTRHSMRLMKHYEIATPLKSFHKFSEAKGEEMIIADLKSGKDIALISDAGTPCISDPGHRLVRRCIKEGLAVQALPGPCAAIAALISSGLETERFQFVGFLPKKEKALRAELVDLLNYPYTTICYESPHRLKKFLSILDEIAPKRTLAVCRELTKTFEEIKQGSAKELIEHFGTIKGEIVLLISGRPSDETLFDDMTIEEHVAHLEKNYQLTKNEAIKMVATLRQISKKKLYNNFIE